MTSAIHTDIIKTIRETILPQTVIPKPRSKNRFIVKSWGMRKRENALIYLVPNSKNPVKPHQKGITESEFRISYSCLMETGTFSHQWFKEHLPRCAGEGSCNFTTIGGIFEKLELAKYEKPGLYKRI